ncbi:formyltetrahydrofolate deformylase [Maribrevibacterium harenarium]|uniref:Formyltetrahydrofolate deformylase n=1 Tax=Maribrevibacterium harenarium TaxID=2589817 RepID=A0A501WPQ1_9GAMM|nr:formyltetrahydrofolate deformylase [Maribrevibacterium harenarium]TPE51318.1 formyltetrahydrofolate deformylase [Maribrevibacterium harenarium]
MKLKLTPTQNLCIGFIESGFDLVELDDKLYFVKGERRQKVLPKTLDALVSRGALAVTDDGQYQLSEEFKQHRQRMREPFDSGHTRH